MEICALLPMKKNSERVPGKNIKILNGKPLFLWVLDSLLNSKYIKNVVINTDNIEYFEPYINKSVSGNVIFRSRNKDICGDMVSMNEVIMDDIRNLQYEHFLMTHATNPLISSDTFDSAIQLYLQGRSTEKYDSLFSVNSFYSRFYSKHLKAINHDPKKLIRTQDMEPIYEENSNFYIFSKQSFLKTHSRIGAKPNIFVTPKIESFDIDTSEDWDIVSNILGSNE